MIGIDEVGRGAWAGPLLVVAARQTAEFPPELTDSKKLTKRARNQAFDHLLTCSTHGEGWVTPTEIDDFGMTEAMRLGVSRALDILQASPDEPIVMDGKINYCHERFRTVETLIGADKQVPVVSCASVIAKVMRDRYMQELAVAHPNYRLESNVGYGTTSHRLGLDRHGPVRGVHRFSFAPIANLTDGNG